MSSSTDDFYTDIHQAELRGHYAQSNARPHWWTGSPSKCTCKDPLTPYRTMVRQAPGYSDGLYIEYRCNGCGELEQAWVEG